jgi:hypothetical protein
MSSSLLDTLMRHCRELPKADAPETTMAALDLPALVVVLDRRDRRGRR